MSESQTVNIRLDPKFLDYLAANKKLNMTPLEVAREYQRFQKRKEPQS